MSRSIRRSNLERTSPRSSENRNILSFNSDGDVSNKRNSWWKNLPGNLRRSSSQLLPERPNFFNSHSSIEEEELNSQWWKNLSENERVSLPIKLKSSAGEGNRSNDNPVEKNLSQDVSENEDVSKNIFPKKSIFASQEQPSQKSRYSRAFNLNTERQIEKESQKQTKTEIEEFATELEENKVTQSPTSKLIKANKKRRRTKSIFSKRPIKRTYNDVFIDATEPKEVQNKGVLQDDSKDDMTEKFEKKEKLFKLNLKKKKYSEAFFDEPVENNSNNTQVEECSKVQEKVILFKTKKKYSEAFDLSKSKLSQNSESDEEINIEEIQTQKDASYTSNRSVNVTRGRKSSLHKTLEKTPSKQIQNEIKIVTSGKRNLRSATPKRKESVVQPTITLIDTESSDNENFIEEVISQKVSAETKYRKSLRPSGSKILQGNNENRDVENKEVDETKLDPSQKTKKSQILHNETEKEESFEEKSVAQTTTKKELFQKNTRNKRYSEAFLGSSTSSTLQTENNKSHSEKEINENDEKSLVVTRTQKGLFQRNTRNKQYSEAFLGSSINQTLQDDNNKSQSEREIGEHVEKSIESPRTRKGLFERHTRSKQYSEAFLGSSKNNTLQDDNDKSQRIQEIDGPAEKFIESPRTQRGLLQRNTRSKQYSEGFLGSSTSKPLQDNAKSQRKSESDEPDEKSLEQTRTQKDSFQRNTRSKQDSEALLGPVTNQTFQDDNNKSQSEREIGEHVEKSIESPRTKKGLFERNTRNKQYSEAFLASSKNNTQDDNDKSQRIQEIDGPAEKSIESPKTQKGLLHRNTRSKQYSEEFLDPSTSKTLQDNAKSQKKKKIDEPDEKSLEQTRTQKDSLQINTRSKQHSEGFLGPLTNQTLKDDNNKSQSEREIGEHVEKSIESPRTRKGLFERHTRSKQYSEAFLGSSKNNTLHDDNDKSQRIQEIDGPVEKSIESPRTQRGLLQRNTRSKQYSEGFLGSSTSKTLQEKRRENEIDKPDEKSLEQTRTQKDSFQRNTRSKQYPEGFLSSSDSKTLQNNEESQSEKEIDEPNDKSLVQTRKQKDLFQRNTRSKRYSESFLYPSTSKTLHSSDDKSQSEKKGIVNLQAGGENKENNQVNKVSSQEMLSRQRESFDQIMRKNTTYSQAFLEFLATEKPIEEGNNNTPDIKNVEHNKSDKEIAEKESVNDTHYSSISSINVSDKIKHPLFRTQARRSLYSTKSTGNVNEEKEKQSTHAPQQQDVENNKSKKIKTKRISLRSTSPAESGISKFFDESLISSTKYFINSNEGTGSGSEETATTKSRKSKKLSSDGNNEKDKKHTTRRHTPSRKDRNSKLLSIVSEHPDNSLINENKMIKDNKDVQSEDEINDKNSNLQKENDSKLLLKAAEHSDNENQMVEENQETHSEDQTKTKNSVEGHREDENENFVFTSSQKSKSVTKSCENKMNEENRCSTEHSDPNKDQIGFSRSRRSNSVTRVSENSAQNKTGNEPTTDNTDVKHNKKLKKKRKRPAKSTTIHESSQNIIPSEQEIVNDERNINETEKSAEKDKIVTDKKRKLSVKTSENVDLIPTGNEVEEDDNYKNIESDKSRISKKSSFNRKRKSSLITDRNSNIFSDEKDVETEDIRKSFLVSESVGIAVEKLPENNKKRMEVSNTYNQMSSEEETDAVFIKKSLESIKSRKIKSNSQTSLANKILENIQEKSLQIKTPMQLSFDSNNHKKLSSKSSIDRSSDSRAISGIITINSSISRARSSQTNQNTENWLSKSNITNNARFEENYTRNSQESNIDPVSKKRKIIKDKCLPVYNEKENFERHKILVNAAKNIGSKQKILPPRAPDKKITDFFSKLGKDEKLKPIPKKVKKTLRPVCTARLIDGKPYYSKKLFHGERWCTEKFYKCIQNKIRTEYGDDTINESENVMRYIVSSVKTVIKSKKHLKKEVDDLKKELARHGIISTTHDFFRFCFEYLPAEYRDLVIPRTQCGTAEPTVPYNEEDIFKKIVF